jgi:hypothetical protein
VECGSGDGPETAAAKEEAIVTHSRARSRAGLSNTLKSWMPGARFTVGPARGGPVGAFAHPTLASVRCIARQYARLLLTPFPGRSAARSGALLNREHHKLGVSDDPGSAAHRCALRRVRETFRGKDQ